MDATVVDHGGDPVPQARVSTLLVAPSRVEDACFWREPTAYFLGQGTVA